MERRRKRELALLLCGVLILFSSANGYPAMGKILSQKSKPAISSGLTQRLSYLTNLSTNKADSAELQKVSRQEDQGGVQIVVQKGDTLWSLARFFGTTVDDLIKLNQISNPDLVRIGEKIWVKAGSGRNNVKADRLVYHNTDDLQNISQTAVTQEELELLARVIYGEARGESFEGQVAVGAVVINRLNSPGFPKTISEVIYQPGAFTAVDDRQIHLTPGDEAYQAAQAALNGQDPSNGALFYYNPKTATDKWIKSRTVIKTIGNHAFSI